MWMQKLLFSAFLRLKEVYQTDAEKYSVAENLLNWRTQKDEDKIASKAIKKGKVLKGERFFKACWVQKVCLFLTILNWKLTWNEETEKLFHYSGNWYALYWKLRC